MNTEVHNQNDRLVESLVKKDHCINGITYQNSKLYSKIAQDMDESDKETSKCKIVNLISINNTDLLVGYNSKWWNLSRSCRGIMAKNNTSSWYSKKFKWNKTWYESDKDASRCKSYSDFHQCCSTGWWFANIRLLQNFDKNTAVIMEL